MFVPLDGTPTANYPLPPFSALNTPCVARLLDKAPTLRAVFNALMLTLPSLCNVSALLFLMYGWLHLLTPLLTHF